MYAECPHCQALYRITQNELDAADGWVRCGTCGQVFEAIKTPNKPAEPETHIDTPNLHNTHEDSGLDFDPGETDELSEAETEVQPKARRRHRRGSTWLWSGIILLLIALLSLQYVYSQRNQLAKYRQLRPALATLCNLAHCTLEPQRDLAAIVLTSRNIFTHPNIPHSLMITATIVNQAAFPQPYPLLQISFSNLEGKTVALGRFTPAQYLPKNIDPRTLMPIRKPINLSFTVNDPGQQALAYEFSFKPYP